MVLMIGGGRRRIREIVIPDKEPTWEPGIRDGVFSRTRKFPILSQEDMIREIYYKLILNDTKSYRSKSGSDSKDSSFVWTLTDTDVKDKPKKKVKVDVKSKESEAVWEI